VYREGVFYNGAFTLEEFFRFFFKQELESSIDALRDILNDMCCTIDESDFNIEMLDVSQQLDKVIVEYMGLESSS